MCNLLADLSWSSQWVEGDTHTCRRVGEPKVQAWILDGLRVHADIWGSCESGYAGEYREWGCVSGHLGISALISWRGGAGLHYLYLHNIWFLVELYVYVSVLCVCVHTRVQNTCEPKNAPGSKECTWMDFSSQEEQSPGPGDHRIQQLPWDP